MVKTDRSGRKGLTRTKFLGFLGKIGLLSLIPGLQAHAAERYQLRESKDEDTGFRKFNNQKIEPAKFVRSPSIKGKTLSRAALEETLATQNLEDIRDVMTGRFFGRIARDVFKDGPVPLIRWGLGEINDSSCFLYANTGGKAELEAKGIDNCSLYLYTMDDKPGIFIDIFNEFFQGIGGGPQGDDCPGQCSWLCLKVCSPYCMSVCMPHVCPNLLELDLYQLVSYPADRFVSEITDILKTTDVATIQEELKAVIFSDEVLNMGLQHFVLAAHDAMVDEIEGIEAGF